MKLKLRIDKQNPEHTHFTVFCNGANCGTLCMRNDEFKSFTTGIEIINTIRNMAKTYCNAIDTETDETP